jgi:4-amino-4-deoxy-L-arabinose transferase-like glycosyltransferase
MANLKAAQPGLASRLGQTWQLLFLILGVGGALRLHMIGAKSLWGDEAFSVTVARMSLPEIVRTAWWGEANMTLYYLFLRVWVHFGDTEFWMRSLSALFGVLTIAATYALGKRFLSQRVGIVAAALLAVHSYHIRYSQELRSYTLVTLLVVLSTYAFLAVLEAPDRKAFWVLYALFSALAIYAQVLSVFVLCGQWLVLTPARIKHLGIFRLLSVGTAIGILAAPIAAVMLLQNKGQIDWVPRPTLIRIYDVLQDMAGTEPVGSQNLTRSSFLFILYAATWILAFASLYLVRPGHTAGKVTKISLQVLVLGFVFPIAAMIGVSFVKPIMFPRYLLMCVPAAVLLASQGLITLEQCLPRGRIISSAVLLTMVTMASFSIRDYYASFENYGHDWRRVTSFLLSQQQPEDAVIFYTFSGHRVFDYYLRREREAGVREGTPAVLFPLELERASIEKSTLPYHRVWLILHQTIPSAETDTKTEIIRAALQDHFQLASEKEFPGAGATRDDTGTIQVALYVAAPAGQ